MRNTNPLQTSVFLRTFDLPYPGHKEIPLTLRWNGYAKQPEEDLQFGYQDDEISPTIVVIDALQELGFQEVTHYRKFGDSQLYGVYSITPTALIKHGQVVPSLTMFGWIALPIPTP